ncbi:MAG: 4'-phosphopantetheinyl transferase superfamily protein [Ruminiclostridium sp.]|nr:4'-phosphopantetheinyl transferase superfamily protein [Ruminiclostridium sp.]
MIYIKRIISKKEYGKGYHNYCHNEGLSLLNHAVSCEYPDFDFCEDAIKKGYRGKPYIEGAQFHYNISHADGLVVCALSQTEVGIDAESIRETTDRVMKRCYSDSEIAYVNSAANKDTEFTRIWTLKESYVKLTGEGIATDLKSVCFDLEQAVSFSDELIFLQFAVSDTHIVTVCQRQVSGKIFFSTLNDLSDDIVVIDI